jgi:cytidine deaminase
MREKLEQLLNNAYSPYYHFRVASIVVTKDGSEFNGVNVENASPASGVCAERNAINNAIAAGYKKGDFRVLYVMVEGDKISYPCFVCRQTISEFFDMNDDIIVYTKGGLEDKKKVSDLIVYPFDKEDLK